MSKVFLAVQWNFNISGIKITVKYVQYTDLTILEVNDIVHSQWSKTISNTSELTQCDTKEKAMKLIRYTFKGFADFINSEEMP